MNLMRASAALPIVLLICFFFVSANETAFAQEQAIEGAASGTESLDESDSAGGLRAQVLVVLIGLTLLILCILMHYEALRILSRLIARLHTVPRARIVFLIVGLIIVHQAEVWVWAWGYFGVSSFPSMGSLSVGRGGLLSYVYFSATTYTTLGYGDLIPLGPIRFLAATESLLGLVLVGWSTAFTFLEMQRFWNE